MVDIILGLIFITAIVCFTVYKINKVNKLGGKKVKQVKEKKVLEEVQEKLEDILYENDMSSTKSQIGFKYNKSTRRTLQKEKPKEK